MDGQAIVERKPYHHDYSLVTKYIQYDAGQVNFGGTNNYVTMIYMKLQPSKFHYVKIATKTNKQTSECEQLPSSCID